MSYYEIYLPNDNEPKISSGVRKLRGLPDGTVIWRVTPSERYQVVVVSGRALIKYQRRSNNRMNLTASRMGAQESKVS